MEPNRTEWLLSQAKHMMQPGDESLPGVSPTAKCLALDMIAMLSAAWETDEEDGRRIVISDWAVHRMALAIAEIAVRGLDWFDGCDGGERRERLAAWQRPASPVRPIVDGLTVNDLLSLRLAAQCALLFHADSDARAEIKEMQQSRIRSRIERVDALLDEVAPGWQQKGSGGSFIQPDPERFSPLAVATVKPWEPRN